MSGYIGYYKLLEWWRATFTQEERAVIEQKWHETMGKSGPTVLTSQDFDALIGEDALPAESVTFETGEANYVDYSRLTFLKAVAAQIDSTYPHLAARVRAKISELENEK